jgi:hypothetical protein
VVAAALFVLAPPRCLRRGLVAAGFEEESGSTVTDASGTGNNGTLTNATWTTSGRYGNALGSTARAHQ